MLERPHLAHPSVGQRIVREQSHARIPSRRRAHQIARPIGRPAVDDEHLEHWPALCAKALEARLDARRLVERRDDHAHGGVDDLAIGWLDGRQAASPRPETREEYGESD